MADKVFRLEIRIDGLDDVQAKELIRMFWLMNRLGQIGASRWLAFYADGDGSFRPHISINDIPVSVLEEQELTGAWEAWRRGNIEAFLFDPD
ncbi:MAG: hypothetical protein ACXABY_15055 [Candidatus Thorarchaeota archaeon]|jgi:hypothetical protein